MRMMFCLPICPSRSLNGAAVAAHCRQLTFALGLTPRPPLESGEITLLRSNTKEKAMALKFRFLAGTSILALCCISAIAAPPVPSCAKEIGTVIPHGQNFATPGTYVQATGSRNFHIKPGECLVSPSRLFTTVMQSDGQLVMYRTEPTGDITSVWDAKTVGNPDSSALVQQDGVLVVYSAGGVTVSGEGVANGNPNKAILITNMPIRPFNSYYLIQQDDGNLVLYFGTPGKYNNGWRWSSITGPWKPSNGDGRGKTFVCENTPDGMQCQNK